jgi:hypothetical protein
MKLEAELEVHWLDPQALTEHPNRKKDPPKDASEVAGERFACPGDCQGTLDFRDMSPLV